MAPPTSSHRRPVATALAAALLLAPLSVSDAEPVADTVARDAQFSALATRLPPIVFGQLVMTSGGGAGLSGACLDCHGADGRGDAAAAVPRLAGQSSWYLATALRAYALGTRPHPVMGPIAANLTAAQRDAVAVWYAAQAAPGQPMAAADSRLLARGRRLDAEGDPQRGIQACAACHGPRGQGVAPAIPYIAGQPVAYTTAQLQAWRSGVRRDDPLGAMAHVARTLSPDDIRAVAAWFASLPPPVVD